MSGRASSRQQREHLQLDSFMDILFNVIGAFFFVLVYVALSSSGARGKVTLPMVSPAETKEVFFECRHDTVLFPDIEGLRAQASNAVARAGRSDYGAGRDLRSMGVTNSFYVTVNSGHFVPVPESRGETSFQAGQEGSLFREHLARFDPANRHVFFIVRTDSFEVFHGVRKIALECGFRIGWEPYDKDRALTFGSSGRTPGVDL